MTIQVNGQTKELNALGDGATLQEVVGALELKADRIAVEHNGELARRAEWGSQAVQAGDRLEIVHFVGGGAV